MATGSFWIVAMAALGLVTAPAYAAGPWDSPRQTHVGSRAITVYHSPTCGCCKDWIAHLRRHGFEVSDVQRNDVMATKRQLGLPDELASCHTAVIDGYVIEGHVPADDIKRLVADKPALAGLAVPGMPSGAPGMEQGARRDPFAVLGFDRAGGIEPYSQYWKY